MGKIYILPNNTQRRSPFLKNESLPHFYMSDHSVLGILVREIKKAIIILEKQKWPLTRTEMAFNQKGDWRGGLHPRCNAHAGSISGI
jgi:hypothetical protein